MKKIMFVWELGAGLGHIASFLPFAKQLKREGYQPVLVLKDVMQARSILKGDDILYIQSPIWTHQRKNAEKIQLNFTDSLFNFGYLDSVGLSAVIDAWVNLFHLVKPDAIIFDFSPTALLASRAFNIPKVIFGNCFSIPPSESPLPEYLPKENVSYQERLINEEKLCVSNINKALSVLNISQIDHVYDIYSADHCFITTESIMDIYHRNDGEEYLGSVSTSDIGTKELQWPKVTSGNVKEAKKIFVYIKPNYPHIDNLFIAMKESCAIYIVYVVGFPESKKQQYESSNIFFSASPCNIESVIEESDGAIIHGGNLIERFLTSAIPLFLLPLQVENLMMSKSVMEQRAGVVFYGKSDLTIMKKKLDQFIFDKNLKIMAELLSKKMTNLSEGQQVNRVVEVVKGLL